MEGNLICVCFFLEWKIQLH